jgi:hypothetical protein
MRFDLRLLSIAASMHATDALKAVVTRGDYQSEGKPSAMSRHTDPLFADRFLENFLC